MTFSALLTNLKTLLLTYQTTTLSKIKTYQRGVLGPQCVYPVLAILPIRQSFEYGYSNGKYESTYQMVIEIYDLKLGVTQAHDNTVDLIQAVKTILQSNSTISGSVYDLRIESEGYGDTVQISRGWLQRSFLMISGKSKEVLPTQSVANTITNNVNPKDLQDYILQIIKNNKASYYSTVNTMKDSVIAPVPVLPAILIGAGTKQRIQDYPNADVSDINFDIMVITELFAKEIALNHNMTIVEGVVDVLQADPQWGGRCDYSNIKGITYESYSSPQNYYASNIDFLCRVREYQ